MNRLALTLTCTAVVLMTACTHSGRSDIVFQSDWGGTPAPVDSAQSIKYITIHHSGVVYESGKDPLTYLRNLQSWSRSEKNWVDIPYHYIIDPQGQVYEGRDARLAGDTNTSYDVEGHLIICVLGNFEEQAMNDDQITALVKLTAISAKQYGVPPGNIRSHHDWVPEETVCPGRDIQKMFENGGFAWLVSQALEKLN